MSGFQVPRTTYKLVFDEEDYAGLVIRVRGTTLDELFEMDDAQDAINDATTTQAGRAAIRARDALFVDKVIEWNIEDNGAPVPCTVESLSATLEAPFRRHVVETWRRAAAGVVAAPLVDSSTSGESTELDQTLMNIPAESLAS